VLVTVSGSVEPTAVVSYVTWPAETDAFEK